MDSLHIRQSSDALRSHSQRYRLVEGTCGGFKVNEYVDISHVFSAVELGVSNVAIEALALGSKLHFSTLQNIPAIIKHHHIQSNL